MPVTYRIDTKRGIVWTTATGSLTDADLVGHKRRLVADPAFRPGMCEISDVRGIDSFNVTIAGISQFAALDRADADRLRGHRLAIVAPEDVVYGMARVYQSMTDGTPQSVMVFREISEAMDWLGVAGPPHPPEGEPDPAA